jgi:pyruvate dehydrogenase E1 component alpha subunit
LSEQELADMDARAKQAVDEAVKFAQDSPYPALDQVYTDVYVSYP